MHDKTSASIDKNPFFQISNDITADDFPFDSKNVFEFANTVKLNVAMHELAKQNLLSAPVYDVANKKYLGFCDVGDLMGIAAGLDMLLQILPKDMIKSHKAPNAGDITLTELFEGSNNNNTMVSTWCPVNRSTSLKEIIALLATKARRIPVIDKKTGKVCKIITQSAVVHELYRHIVASGERAPKELHETPKTTGIGTKNVITINENEPAIKAFDLMLENNISAIGVTDFEGKLMTCISSKDIRLLPMMESIILDKEKSVLHLPVREYIVNIRKIVGKTGRAYPAVITCSENTPIRIIIGKLSESHRHRVFMVDDKGYPIGVVSVSDILSLLVEEQEWESNKKQKR